MTAGTFSYRYKFGGGQDVFTLAVSDDGSRMALGGKSSTAMVCSLKWSEADDDAAPCASPSVQPAWSPASRRRTLQIAEILKARRWPARTRPPPAYSTAASSRTHPDAHA